MKHLLPSRIPLCMLLFLPAMLMAQETYLPLHESEHLVSAHLIPFHTPLISSTSPTIPCAIYRNPQSTLQVQYNGNGVYHTAIRTPRYSIISPLYQNQQPTPSYHPSVDNSSLPIYHACAIPRIHTQGTLAVRQISQEDEKNMRTIRHSTKANPAPSHTTPIGDSLIPLLLAACLYALLIRHHSSPHA